ncbi:MAG: hypothetical protein WCO25_02490 [Candidatus Uhrbacteria bacterium]
MAEPNPISPEISREMTDRGQPRILPLSDRVMRGLVDVRAAAEARTTPRSLLELTDAFEARFAKWSDSIPKSRRGNTQERLARARELLEANDLSNPEWRSIRIAEVQLDLTLTETRLVSSFLRDFSPEEAAETLRAGAGHPRFVTEALLRQRADIAADLEPTPILETFLAYVPESLRTSSRVLSSDLVPPRARGDARRLVNQIANRSFREAKETWRAVMLAWVGMPEHLIRLPSELEREALQDDARDQRLYACQVDMYDAIVASHAERRESIERRRRTEEIFRRGKIVGVPRPVISTEDHAASPVIVTFQDGDDTRQAVVKFSFSERFAREGVTPGNGKYREVAASMHAVGFGVEAPAVVSRRLEPYGDVTVLELLDGKDCSRIDEWFQLPSGRLRPEIGPMAVASVLLNNSDLAPRNIMRTSRGLVPIDYGSDLSSDVESPFSSVPLLLMSESGDTVPESLQERVVAWRDSAERKTFERMVGLLPENMGPYLEAYGKRIDAMVARFVADGPGAKYPKYLPRFRRDFGEKFAAYLASKSAQTPRSRPSGPDVTRPL